MMSQLGLPAPRMPKDAGLYVQVDTALRTTSRTQPAGRIPSVVGMSAMDAAYLLRRMGYQPRLKGAGNVLGQSISAGTVASPGTEVVLELGYPN